MRSITFPRTNVVAAPRSIRRSLSSTVASRICKTLSNDFYSSSLSSLLFLPFAQLNCANWERVSRASQSPASQRGTDLRLRDDRPGGKSRVALALTLEPGWHVYWVYAGDSGEAPEVQWSAPPGISMGPMQYAAPSRLPLGPLMDYGYEGTAVFPFTSDGVLTDFSREWRPEGARAAGWYAGKSAFPVRRFSDSI